MHVFDTSMHIHDMHVMAAVPSKYTDQLQLSCQIPIAVYRQGLCPLLLVQLSQWGPLAVNPWKAGSIWQQRHQP